MQIEVTLESIVRYGLVQLTGNSSEKMMELAEEAKQNGHVLCVEVPDDDLVHMNIFEAAGSSPADPEMGNDRHPLDVETVKGEVIERTDGN